MKIILLRRCRGGHQTSFLCSPTTAKYLDRYRHIEHQLTHIYAAMVASLDDSVGAVVDKLRAVGALDNTRIVFSSDNGCADYVQGACSNKPFAGFKRYHQEGGIRVRLMEHPMSTSTGGRVSRHRQPSRGGTCIMERGADGRTNPSGRTLDSCRHAW